MTASNLLSLFSNLIFLSFVVGIPCYALVRKVDLWSTFTEGAQQGFQLAIRLIPPLVAMLVAIGMFRAAGGFDYLAKWLQPLLARWQLPAEIVPLALIRPFSGSSANAMLADIAKQYGGDSFVAHLAATLVGSTETTFYIVAVYFGAVAIRKTRYAITVGLLADAVGILMAIMIARWFWLH